MDSVQRLCKIAQDSSHPESFLKLLATHRSWRVREAVSDNPSLPLALIQRLANDKHVDVRFAIADNHNTPLNILGELCEDENPFVSWRAAKTLARVRQSYGFGMRCSDAHELETTMTLRRPRLHAVI